MDNQSQVYANALQELTVRYERLVQALSILKSLDQIDSPDLDFDQICRHLVETMASGLAAENCSLMLFDGSLKTLELKAACGPFQTKGSLFGGRTRRRRTFALGEGIVGMAAQSGESIRIDDVSTDTRFMIRENMAVNVKSILCFPLISDERIIGVLNLSHSNEGFFTVESERTLSLVADRIARRLSVLALQQKLKESEEHYRQAAKMEALGTLAGGIAHDFNNILQVIIGFGEMAVEEAIDESPQEESIKEILIAANRGSELARQILAFSRHTDQARRPIRLQPIIREALGLIRGSTPKSVRVLNRIDEKCGPVLADATSMHQIIINLCTNAFHAMKKNGGQLTISLEEVKSGEAAIMDLISDACILLKIQDTGEGIDDSIKDRIFEPYFTTKKSGEGTGLGLATVHGIVKSHHGLITVESEIGSGTEFCILLPRYSRSTEGHRTAHKLKSTPTGDERILFVDDEAQVAELGRRTLSSLGYEVKVRTSSVEALELFRTNPDRFDLLVTDLTMPNLTGLELADRVNQIRKDLPIIVTTGFSESVSDKSRAIGVVGTIRKPFVAQNLAIEIRRVLDSTE